MSSFETITNPLEELDTLSFGEGDLHNNEALRFRGEELHNPEGDSFNESDLEDEKGSDHVSDEEILSDEIYEKIKDFIAREIGGTDEEISVSRDFDGRNLSHFKDGEHYDNETGMPTSELFRKWALENNEPPEVTEKKIADLKLANDHLFNNRNKLFRTNDTDKVIDGVRVRLVGLAVCDSEGRTSYFDVIVTPSDEKSSKEDSEPVPDLNVDNAADDRETENQEYSPEPYFEIDENIKLEAKLTELFAEPVKSEASLDDSRSIADLLASAFMNALEVTEPPIEESRIETASTEVVMKSLADTYEQEKVVSIAPIQRPEVEAMKVEMVVNSDPDTGPAGSPEKIIAPVDLAYAEELHPKGLREEVVGLPKLLEESIPELVLGVIETEQAENISEVTTATEMKEVAEITDSIVVEVEDQINLEVTEIKSERIETAQPNPEQSSEKDSPEESSGIKIVKLEAQEMSSEVQTMYVEPAPLFSSEKLEQDARIRSSEILRMIGISLRETEKTSQFQNQTPEILRRGQQYVRSYFVDESEIRSAANDNQDLRIMNVNSRDGITMRIAA